MRCRRPARSVLISCSRLSAAVVLLGTALASGAVVFAQVSADAEAGDGAGFSIRKEDPRFVAALEDFQRYSEKKTWERAFRAIAEVLESEPKGMVADENGFFFPSKTKVLRSLASLPPDGREAYRLFYDAKAKQLLDRATSADQAGRPEQVSLLRQIFDRYFITSWGDDAADLLGDCYFEFGDFAAAEYVWRAIVDQYADTDCSVLRIQTKRGIASARAGDVARLAEIATDVLAKFPGQTVKLGGRDVVAADFLQSLQLESKTRQQKPIVDASSVEMTLPASDAPAWQMEFVRTEQFKEMNAQMGRNGWIGMMPDVSMTIPATATDGKRLYANWLGVVWAMDVTTGKMLWRTRKFSELNDKFMQLVQNGADTDHYYLTAAGESVLVTGVPLNNLNQQENVRLVCLTSDSGKLKWTSQSPGPLNAPLSSWSFCSAPLVVDQTIFVVAHPSQSQELSLLAVSLAKGTLDWSVPLGSAQSSQNWRGMSVVPTPVLLSHRGVIYVLTNNGALLAVNCSGHAIDWVFRCETSAPRINRMQLVADPGVELLQDSILYLKDGGGPAMYAIDLNGPSLKWRRPAESTESLNDVKGGLIFLAGKDLAAIDSGTRAMTWVTQLPSPAAGNVIVSGERAYTFLGRGIYEFDTRNGDFGRVVRGADRDSRGGRMYVSGGRVICVSNRMITAYPLPEIGAEQRSLKSGQGAGN
jgi:outer membrane protein assembly factor BamB